MVLFPSVFGSSGFFADFFLNPAKLPIVLAFLIPLVILYLIRPKPQNVQVPSLMFILKDMGKSNVHRFFRTLFQDVLFLIQLLAILLLALAMAKPYMEVAQESLVDQNIIVLDVSASTKAFGEDRFDEMRKSAVESLSNKNIVILAKQNPALLTDNGNYRLSAGDAKALLDDTDPADMQGDLPSALVLAEQYVGENSKVTVISDFVLSALENEGLIEAKLKVLKSKGALIEIKSFGEDASNTGIVDAQLNPTNGTITLKIQNFNGGPEEIGLEYNDQQITLPKKVLAPRGQPGSLISVSVPLANGATEFKLTPKDDFMVDNSYFVSIPNQDVIRVLLITNDGGAEQSNLVDALQAAGDKFTRVEIEYAQPPKVPDLEHDIYIIKDINTQFVLPGIIKGMEEELYRGKVFIVFAQPDIFNIDFLGMMPTSYKSGASPLVGRQDIRVNTSLSLTKGLADIGQVDGSKVLRVEKTDNAIVYAAIPTNEGLEPLIAAKRTGSGATIYWGVKDSKSFDIDPQSYAILWGRIVDFSLTDPMLLNVPTGAVLTSGGKIKTPDGRRDSPVITELAGFYQAGERTMAANLYPLHTSLAASVADQLSARVESSIMDTVDISAEDITTGTGDETQEVKVPRDLSKILIIVGLLIVIFELFYIKYRGDL